MSDVFISYAREDQQQAEWLASLLVARGWSVFWDRTIPPGKTWDEIIGSELDAARAVVVLWSDAGVASAWVKEEAHEAKSRGVLVPAQLDAVRPPFGFRQIQAAQLSDWDGDAAHAGLVELLGALSAMLDDASATAAGLAAGEGSMPGSAEMALAATAPVGAALGATRAAAVPAAQPVAGGPRVGANPASGVPTSSAPPPESLASHIDGPDGIGGGPSGVPSPAAAESVGTHTQGVDVAGRRSNRRRVAGLLAAVAVVGTGAYWWRTAGHEVPVASTTAQESAVNPEMVTVPAGTFRMGTELSEADDERPARAVTFARPFGIGKYEVTFDEYAAFTTATGRALPDDRGWGRGSSPVINVSWKDANAYAKWLSEQTGKQYRLPTEAEWEYAARAGTRTKYWWGDEVQRNGEPMANCDGCGSEWDNRQTAPVGRFEANGFGAHDMHGNVWEWVKDCWHDSYEGAPVDGSTWLEGEGGDCSLRVLRGGSWIYKPEFMRSASRYGYDADSRYGYIGIRLAQDL